MEVTMTFFLNVIMISLKHSLSQPKMLPVGRVQFTGSLVQSLLKTKLIDFLSNREIIFYFKYSYSTLHGIFNFRKLNSVQKHHTLQSLKILLFIIWFCIFLYLQVSHREISYLILLSANSYKCYVSWSSECPPNHSVAYLPNFIRLWIFIVIFFEA